MEKTDTRNKKNNIAGLAGAIIIGVVVSIGVFIMFNIIIDNQSEAQCMQRLADENRMSAIRFDSLLETDFNKLGIMADILGEADSIKENVTPELLDNIRTTSLFDDIFVLFSNGEIIGNKEYSKQYMGLVSEAFGSSSGITFINDEENSCCKIIAYTPIFEGRSVIAGVVNMEYYAGVFDMNGSSYVDRIMVIDNAAGTVIMCFDSSGNLIDDRYGSIFEEGIEWGLADPSVINELRGRLGSSQAGGYDFKTDYGKQYISYSPLAKEEWTMFMTMDSDVVKEQAYSGRKELIVIIVIILALYMVITLAWVVVQRRFARENESIKMQYKVAELANEAKTRFMSNMSHDIRTPLNAIVGLADICEMNADNPERVKDCIAKQKAASEHLMTLINDVLDMSRIESGKVIFGKSEFDIGEQIHELVVMLRKSMEEKALTCKVTVGDLFHENALGDVQRINRVLLNILSNSVKYTLPGGNITIYLNEKNSDEMGKSIYEYRVSDTGIGMTEEFVKKIFIPFERVEDSTVSKIEGAGLGMTIANELITKMGGSIDVQSVLGQGTTITVSLPLEYVDKPSADDVLPEYSGQYVVAVDPEKDVVDWMDRLVSELGFVCRGTTRGFNALNIVKEIDDEGGKIALILLGWKMPRIDGLELAAEIRKLIGNDVIIALQTTETVDIPDNDIRTAGINAILVAPVFRSDIRSILGGKESGMDDSLSIPDFSGRRVLLVEDHIVNAEIVAEYLNYTGIEVDVVNDGTEAVAKMSKVSDGYYDVILMDIRMPKMNGYDATRKIRGMSREYAKSVPIIALSANAFEEDIRMSKEVGMNGHLAKPVKYDEIYRELNKWF